MEYPTRFMREVGVRAFLRIYWGNTTWEGRRIVSGDCPNAHGHGGPGIHNAQILIGDKLDGYDEDFGGAVTDYADERWPAVCDHCGAAVPPIVRIPCNCGVPGCTKATPESPIRQVFRRVLYQAADGSAAIRSELEPGDMFWCTWYPCADTNRGGCVHGWSNCDGRHLIVVTPDGAGGTHHWDVMGRASNCTMPQDSTHRCWVLHGNPETDAITIDKAGHTCDAGGGSIQVTGWHGVLSGGVLRQC